MKEKKRKNLKNIEILFWVGYVFLLLAEMFLRVEIIKNYVSILDTIGMCILLFFSFIRIVQRKEWKNLKNDIAIEVSINIMRAFIEMRKFINTNKN